MPMAAARPWVASVDNAAPATPHAGTGPQPRMRSGSSRKFRNTVPSTISAGVRTSPTPRMSDWNTK